MRARAVRANPAAFSKYTIKFVKVLEEENFKEFEHPERPAGWESAGCTVLALARPVQTGSSSPWVKRTKLR